MLAVGPENTIVVLDASHVSITFVDSFGRRGFDGIITIIDMFKGLPMKKPPLSKNFLLDRGLSENPR